MSTSSWEGKGRYGSFR